MSSSINNNLNNFVRLKMSEIENNLPVKLNLFSKSESKSFSDYLENANNFENEAVQTSESNTLKNSTNSIQNNPGSIYNSVIPSNIKNVDELSTSKKTMDKIENSIDEASQKYNIDSDLIRAIIKQESNYNKNALSGAGAQGLMQIMPQTAQYLGIDDPWDISQNIDGGTKYIKEQLNTFNNNLELAVAAYNAGPGNVQKYNGIPPFEETKNYVEKVLTYYKQYKNN
jgi:soluble lytic murein transglycosylase-like protein